MEVELQLAALRISPADTPADLALEVAAPRVECAEKMLVSMPAECITLFSQWPIVAALTGLWGLRTEINSWFLFTPEAPERSLLDLFS